MKSLSVRQKAYIGLALVFLAITFTGLLFFLSVKKSDENSFMVNTLGRQRVLAQLMAKSILEHASTRSAKDQIEGKVETIDHFITDFRKTYSTMVVGPAQAHGLLISQSEATLDSKSIPSPVTFTRKISEVLGADNNLSLELLSDNPINPAKGLKTELDKEAFNHLSNTGSTAFSKIFERDGKLFLAYYTPDRATSKECATCHNAIQKTKTFDQGDMLGMRRYLLTYADDAVLGQSELNSRLDGYSQAKNMYEATLSAIRFGGPIFIDLKATQSVDIPPIDSPQIQNKAWEISKAFQTFESAVQDFLNAPVGSNAFRQARMGVISGSKVLRVLNDGMVDQFTLLVKESNTNSRYSVSVAIALSVGLLGFMGVYLARSILRPVNNTSKTLQKLSEGVLDQETLPVQTQDEIGILSQSCNDLMAGLKRFINYSENILQGNTDTQEFQAKGEFHLALTRMLEQARKQQEAEREKEQLTKDLVQKNWLSSSLSNLYERMRRGEQDLNSLAQNTISYLAETLNAQVGAIYLKQDDEFKLTGTYAFSKRKSISSAYKMGEGLIGQAALEKDIITITNIPDDYIRVVSGLGDQAPTMILVAPLIHEDQVKGVLELASVHTFDDAKLEFVRQSCEILAISFHLSQTQDHLKELLEESRAQADELAQQQVELQEANQELESQTDALRNSEAKLVQQQEELQETNRQLEEQASILENQKQEIEKKNKLVNEKVSELEISSKYKSEFLANMSHELRTPLNSMLILSRLLVDNKDNNLTDKQTEFAKTIHSSGNDLLNLINDILDLSKIESGNMEMVLEDMELDHFVDSLKRNFQPVADEQNLEFTINLQPGLPKSMVCDGKHLEQTLRNLLSNAFKFTEKGGVTVSIFRPDSGTTLANSKLKPSATIAFQVTDTGKGIHETKRAQIFEAFQQEDGTTSRKYGGTGLGLSITREFVRLMGGEIQLESKLGDGSTFTIFLPEKAEKPVSILKTSDSSGNGRKNKAIFQPDTPTSTATNAEVDDDRQDIRTSDRTLLIIEDDLKFAHLLKDMARDKGFKCLIADDGENGILLAQQFQPSAIILDVGLPGIDGLMVMDKLKNRPETKTIPVHFISALDKDKEAMSMGAIGFLKKPVTPEKIDDAFLRIEKVISKGIKNLLVIEDETIVQDEIKKMLGNSKTHVITATTAEVGMQALEENEIDCIVLDLHLDGISGFDFLENIKKVKKFKHIPVIVYTGRELTPNEEVKLKRFSESIIIKGAHSLERLIDEATLFLHKVAESQATGAKTSAIASVDAKVFSGKKILLVDDDLRNVFALAHVLEEYDMTVVIAKHGKEALEQLNTNKDVDLVLMDIMMPEMDGYECMQEIRKKGEFKNLPIIALTAKAMKGDKQKCLEAGANDYLTKPVDIETLLNQIKVWVLHENEH
ncbi:hybrid sensor histidine kinase/response regulator [Nitrospina watsonii]|uniref:histidine kinase n=1 Tax=Nitrospina watsonii TaxID=1323948 RepID=A0ABM9HEX9_9BACT|nr:response regulator [Nitrospina watsonii]CAI2718629.1 putative Histidine kinase [Nitrospina watsonii]